jgi:phage I-like protein
VKSSKLKSMKLPLTPLEIICVVVTLIVLCLALRTILKEKSHGVRFLSESELRRALRRDRRQRKTQLNAKAPEHGFIFAAGQAIAFNAAAEGSAALPEVIQIAPFGRWPTRDKKAVQVFNAESAEQILSWFNFFPRRLARLARINSVKVWVGHPDFAPQEWPERIELGSITELMIDEHGLNARVEWNAEAMPHVTKHKFPSVAWDCDVNSDGTETPAMLWSVGMWHRPNIKSVQPVINAEGYEDSEHSEDSDNSEPRTENPEQPEPTMLMKILAALIEAGITKDTDSEDTVIAQIGSMIQSLAYHRESKQREAAMAMQMRTALNAVADVADVTDDALPEVLSSQFSVLSSQLNAVTSERDSKAAEVTDLNVRVNTLSEELIKSHIVRAIETGRATKADEDHLLTQLNADPVKGLEDLLAKPVQLNCKPLNLGGTKPGVMEFQERQVRINTEVTKRMEEGKLSYDDAFNSVKADRDFAPLFAAMQQSQAAE